jgi:hypothetical protein
MQSFLFNLAHEAYINGDTAHLPTVTPFHALQFFARLFLLIAMPIALILTAFIALMGFSFQPVLALEVLAALAISAGIVGWRYLRVRYLAQHGQLIKGKIIDYATRPTLSLSNQTVTVLLYQFRTPANKLIRTSVPLADRLPDGRPYPDIGTTLTILYRTPEHHLVL